MPEPPRKKNENADEQTSNQADLYTTNDHNNMFKNQNTYKDLDGEQYDTFFDEPSDQDSPKELLTKLRTLHHHAITINQEIDTSISLLDGTENKINQKIKQITRGLEKIKNIEWNWWYVLITVIILGGLIWLFLL